VTRNLKFLKLGEKWKFRINVTKDTTFGEGTKLVLSGIFCEIQAMRFCHSSSFSLSRVSRDNVWEARWNSPYSWIMRFRLKTVRSRLLCCVLVVWLHCIRSVRVRPKGEGCLWLCSLCISCLPSFWLQPLPEFGSCECNESKASLRPKVDSTSINHLYCLIYVGDLFIRCLWAYHSSFSFYL